MVPPDLERSSEKSERGRSEKAWGEGSWSESVYRERSAWVCNRASEADRGSRCAVHLTAAAAAVVLMILRGNTQATQLLLPFKARDSFLRDGAQTERGWGSAAAPGAGQAGVVGQGLRGGGSGHSGARCRRDGARAGRAAGWALLRRKRWDDERDVPKRPGQYPSGGGGRQQKRPREESRTHLQHRGSGGECSNSNTAFTKPGDLLTCRV